MLNYVYKYQRFKWAVSDFGAQTKQLNNKKQQIIKKKISTTHRTTHRAHWQGSSGKPGETPNPPTHPTRDLIGHPYQAQRETSVQRYNNVNLKEQ